MDSNDGFYLCPICFEVSESPREHHGRPMLRCNPGQPGDERRKPVINDDGRLHSHAPRWFLEAIGSLAPLGRLQPSQRQIVILKGG